MGEEQSMDTTRAATTRRLADLSDARYVEFLHVCLAIVRDRGLAEDAADVKKRRAKESEHAIRGRLRRQP
jgi:hypothetical protein